MKWYRIALPGLRGASCVGLLWAIYVPAAICAGLIKAIYVPATICAGLIRAIRVPTAPTESIINRHTGNS